MLKRRENALGLMKWILILVYRVQELETWRRSVIFLWKFQMKFLDDGVRLNRVKPLSFTAWLARWRHARVPENDRTAEELDGKEDFISVLISCYITHIT